LNSERTWRGRIAGFTLVELLVVIAIIGILVAMLMPSIQSARESGRNVECRNKLKQFGISINNYVTQLGMFPISIAYNKAGPRPAPQVNGKGWIVSVLPHMDQQNLFDRFEPCFEGDIGGGGGLKKPECREPMATRLSMLQCPSEGGAAELSTDQFQWTGVPVALTNYKGVIGDTRMGGGASIHQGTEPDCHNTTGCNGIFYRNNYQEPVYPAQIRDSADSTFMVGEDVTSHNYHSAAYYCNGDYASCHAPLNYMPQPATPTQWWNVMSFRSLHPGGANFCMVGGSAHFVSENIDHDLYRALSTKAGREVAALPGL